MGKCLLCVTEQYKAGAFKCIELKGTIASVYVEKDYNDLWVVMQLLSAQMDFRNFKMMRLC